MSLIPNFGLKLGRLLLHRRAEAGASFIVVEELLKGDERLAEIAERNNASVEQIVGGCWVRWSGCSVF